MRKVIREFIDDDGKVDGDLMYGEWKDEDFSPMFHMRRFQTVHGTEFILYESEIALDEEVEA